MVYSARVVGANCNCLMGNTTLKCVNYTTGEDSTQTVQVMTMGECGTTSFDTYELTMCASLSSALGVSSVGKCNNIYVRVYRAIVSINI